MTQAFKLSVDDAGIANLVFDLPGAKVNTLNLTILQELDQQLDAIAKNSAIKALLISSGKEDSFVAGADLHQFEPLFYEPQGLEKMINTGHAVFRKLEKLSIPSIALINGACLGGGLELALSCTYRLATDNPKTQIGLPEVSLGIIPGWGGSQRLPRLVGLTEGLGMIVSAKAVNGIKAYKIHLVDGLAGAPFLYAAGVAFAKKILTKEGRHSVIEARKRPFSSSLLENSFVAKSLVFPKVRKEILRKTKGHYPSPLIALQLVEESYSLPLEAGLAKEREVIIKRIGELSPNAKNLISLFFTSEAVKKDTGAPEGTKPIPIQRGAVLGAGTMGGGISWLFANNGIPVRMKDINWEAIGKGFSSVWHSFSTLVKIKKIKPTEALLKMHNVTGTTDYSGFEGADLIIEAATENLDLKRQLFAEVEKVVKPNAVIATNTSSLTIAELENAFTRPERFVGMHFFNPVNRMPLVEVVAGKKSSNESVATAVDACKKMGKTPIVVQDCPGFLVNRIFVPGANEVMRLLEEGVDFERLEKIMLDFGMPMSPFELADEVGNDVGYKVSVIFANAYGKRMEYPALVKGMYDHKLYGKKVNAGFYLYNGKEKKRNPEATKLFTGKGKKGEILTDVDLRDRIFLLMVNEAARCIQEKIVAKPNYLDLALVMGIGFPPFRGGILAYADSLGLRYVVDRLRHFEKLEGERFAPAEYLLELQRNGKTFY